MTNPIADLGQAWTSYANEALNPENRERKRKALADFVARGFPSRKDERWRQFNVNLLSGRSFVPAVPHLAALNDSLINRIRAFGGDAPTVTIVNGRYSAELSNLDETRGIRINPEGKHLPGLTAVESLAPYRDRNEPWELAALNEAFSPAVIEIVLEEGAVINETINIVTITTAGVADALACPQISVVACPGAQATFCEVALGGNGERPTTVSRTTLELGADAQISYYLSDVAHADAIHLGRLDAELNERAKLDVTAVVLDDAIIKRDIVCRLTREAADFRFSGLALAQAKQSIEYFVDAQHIAPETTSDQSFKAIGVDRSRATFVSRAKVLPEAQRISSHQLSRGLLLSDTAEIRTQPQLEIYADDVTCAHGATVGYLDAAALFYLQARGIPHDQAKAMLINAFADDLIEPIAIPHLSEMARSRAQVFTSHADPHGEVD